jgi:hypothetical protein
VGKLERSQEVIQFLSEIGTKGGKQRSKRKADASNLSIVKAREAREQYRRDPASRPKKKK